MREMFECLEMEIVRKWEDQRGDICGEEGERLDDALTRPKNSTTTNISQLQVFLLQFFAGLFVMSFV